MPSSRSIGALAAIVAFWAAGLGSTEAADAPADQQTPASTGGDDQLQTVVVTGIRASLEKSLEIKQNAEIVLDSINALELGRFPDDDVADSLRHITGVSITRTTGGDGQYVGIRGLGQQYNIVTLNNRIVATDDDGRALAFDILPADVISGADVLKSSQASALEGSIGGTVNMRSARPFDNPGFHAAARIEGDYNDMSQYWGKKASAFISNTNADRTWGILLGLVASDEKTRTDSLNYNTYDMNSPGYWPPPNPDGTLPPGAMPVVAECCISFGSVIDEKKRTAISGALEWRPNDKLHFTLDGLYAKLNDPQVAYNQAYYPDFTTDAEGNSQWKNVVVNNGLITSFTAVNFTPEIVNQTIDRQVTTSMIGLNLEWTPTDRLSIATDLYRSRANRPEGGQDAFVTSGLESPYPYNQDTISWKNNNGGLPDILVTLPGGQDYATALANGQLTNDHWTAHYTGLNGNSLHDRVTGATIDGQLKMDSGPLTLLRFGVAGTWRDKKREDYDNDWTGGSSQYDFYTTPAGANPITYGTLGYNVVTTTTLPNYMRGAGGNFPRTVALFNIQNLLAALQSLDGKPNLYGTTGSDVFDFALSLPQYNAVNSYKVSEDTIAAYFEAVFAGSNWNGNLGLRVVHTRTSASTAVNEIVSVTVPDTSIPTAPAYVVYSDAVPTSTTGSYTQALPSLNLTYRFRPDLQLRFGAAETMARPELDQLAATRTDDSLNQDYRVDYNGNSQLKPIRAYSLDLSLEWYYQPKSALTLALFGKDIKDFITTQVLNNQDIGVQGYFNGSTTPVPVLYTVAQPINGDKGYVEGIEFGFTHITPSGFGVHGQYTHTWSKAYVGGVYVGELEGVSSNSGSLGVLYENKKLSANVNWDYQGPSIAQTFTEVDNWKAYNDSFSWVTAQLSYEFLPGFRVYFEGKNLTDSIQRTYLADRKDAVWAFGSPSAGTGSSVQGGYVAYGRSYTLGASYRF
jgi:TonB-dependent receptor